MSDTLLKNIYIHSADHLLCNTIIYIQKTNFNMKKLTLAISFLLVFAVGCKKEKDDSNKPALAFTKGEYKPLELAILQADRDFSAANLTAKIDGETVALAVMDSNRIGVLIPLKGAGSYTLHLETEQFSNNSIDFTIAAYTPIADPQPQIELFEAKMNDHITQLNTLKDQYNWNVSPQNITELQQMQNAFENALASATDEDKKEVAYFVQNNTFLTTPLETITFADSFYAKAATDPGDEAYRIGKKFVASSILIAAEIGIFNALFNTPEPTGITKLLALTTAVALGGQVYYTLSLLEQLGNVIGKADDFNFSGVLNFTSGKAENIIDNLQYRTLKATDIAENNYIKIIVTQVNKFDEYRAKFNAGVDKVKSWFSGVPTVVSGAVSHLKQTPVFKNFYAKHEYLSVGNVSNSNIQLSVAVENGEHKLQATSALTEAVDFTFDIAYKHPDLGNRITKTINAKFTPPAVLTSVGFSSQSNIGTPCPTLHHSCTWQTSFYFHGGSPIGGKIYVQHSWDGGIGNVYSHDITESNTTDLGENTYSSVFNLSYCWGTDESILFLHYYYISATGQQSTTHIEMIPR